MHTAAHKRDDDSEQARIPAQPTKSPVVAELIALQRLAGNAAVTEAVEMRSPVDLLGTSSGRALDADVRADMESRLGADFGDVRIHTDTAAHESAVSLDAHAYTVGSDIVFQRDAYNPNSTSGRTTLAHELTHVVQQRSGPVDGTDLGNGVRVSDPDDRFEREATNVAAGAVGRDAQSILTVPHAAGALIALTRPAVQRDAVRGAKEQTPAEESRSGDTAQEDESSRRLIELYVKVIDIVEKLPRPIPGTDVLTAAKDVLELTEASKKRVENGTERAAFTAKIFKNSAELLGTFIILTVKGSELMLKALKSPVTEGEIGTTEEFIEHTTRSVEVVGLLADVVIAFAAMCDPKATDDERFDALLDASVSAIGMLLESNIASAIAGKVTKAELQYGAYLYTTARTSLDSYEFYTVHDEMVARHESIRAARDKARDTPSVETFRILLNETAVWLDQCVQYVPGHSSRSGQRPMNVRKIVERFREFDWIGELDPADFSAHQVILDGCGDVLVALRLLATSWSETIADEVRHIDPGLRRGR